MGVKETIDAHPFQGFNVFFFSLFNINWFKFYDRFDYSMPSKFFINHHNKLKKNN